MRSLLQQVLFITEAISSSSTDFNLSLYKVAMDSPSIIFLFLLSFSSIIRSETNYPFFFFPNNVSVKYPFTLRGMDYSPQCYRPGFEISSKNNSPILNIPSWGDFDVHSINYWSQLIYLSYNNCLPEKLIHFNLSNSPFHPHVLYNYTMFNCSKNSKFSKDRVISCMDGYDYSVILVPSSNSSNYSLTSCNKIWENSVPIWLEMIFYQYGHVFIQLHWGETSCEDCDARGEDCMPPSMPSIDAQCLVYAKVKQSHLPLGGKIGIPVVIVIIYLAANYVGRRWRERHRAPNVVELSRL